jgi:pimeloyl-ACP methyl ester carboxylesterase
VASRRDVADPYPISTERFVDDLGDAVARLGRPTTLIGHSMGGLHAWCLAASQPGLVKALIVEDMAPDYRGRTTGPWEPWLHALPVEFASAQQVYDEFGEAPGRYWRPSTALRPVGGWTGARALDRDRRRVGHQGPLEPMGCDACADASHRGGNPSLHRVRCAK